MDTTKGHVTEDWWLVFTRSKHKHILSPFLKPGFEHVYAMKKTDTGLLWLIVDSMRSHVHVDIAAVQDYPHPRAYAEPGAVVVPVRAKIDTTRIRGTLNVFNCVEVVKGLLGVKEFWVWTPWQLYKHLRGYNV